MGSEPGPEEGLAAGQRYFALGLKFAAGVVLFTLGGVGLDRWLGITPLGTVVGTLLGAGLSFLSVYRELMEDEVRARRKRKEREAGRGGGGP